jgi:two-component system, LytTR family, sensor kinase
MNQFTNRQYWTLQLAGWTSLLAIFTVFAWAFDSLDSPKYAREFTGRAVIFLLAGIPVSHLMRLVVKRLKILEKPFNSMVFRLMLIFVIAAAIFSTIDILLLKNFGWLKPAEKVYMTKGLFLLIMSNGFTVGTFLLIWLLVYVVYHFVPGDLQHKELNSGYQPTA